MFLEDTERDQWHDMGWSKQKLNSFWNNYNKLRREDLGSGPRKHTLFKNGYQNITLTTFIKFYLHKVRLNVFILVSLSILISFSSP